MSTIGPGGPKAKSPERELSDVLASVLAAERAKNPSTDLGDFERALEQQRQRERTADQRRADASRERLERERMLASEIASSKASSRSTRRSRGDEMPTAIGAIPSRSADSSIPSRSIVDDVLEQASRGAGGPKPTERERRPKLSRFERSATIQWERAKRAKEEREKRPLSEAQRELRAKIEKEAPGCYPRSFDAWVYATAELVRQAKTERELVELLTLDRPLVDQLPWAREAYRAARGMHRKRRITDERARAIITIYLVIIGSREPTRGRPGYVWKTEGYTCRMLRTLLQSPRGGTYSRSAFEATSWGRGRAYGARRSHRYQIAEHPDAIDDCGFFVALARAGVFFRNQPPAHVADPRYVGRVCYYDADGNGVRCAFGVFWIRPPPLI